MTNFQKYMRILTDFVCAGILLAVLIFIVPRALGFFMPFVIGWIISMIANPLVRFLEKNVKMLRKHSSALVIIAALAIVVAAVYFGLGILVREGISLMQDLPEIFAELQVNISDTLKNLEGLARYLPDSTKGFLDDMGSSISGFLTSAISRIDVSTLGVAGSLVKNVADVFLMAIITILSAYFFIADRDKLVAGFKRILPDSVKESMNLIKSNFIEALGAYFKAQFKIMIVMVVILFIGFELLDVHYSFFLGILVAFLDFLPFFGTGTILWPWALMDIIGGEYFHAVCLAIIYLICQLLHQLLQPKLVGDGIGLSPLATLVFMFSGYRIKGVLGMILGIPIGMAVLSLYKAGAFDRLIAGAKVILHDINEYRKWQ
ncbi:MAG: sporulation integral membrane protein YtvI [Acetivibrio ethanolgignens]